MIRPRKRPAPRDSQGQPESDDRLDEDLWRRLRAIIGAANRGDARAHRNLFLRWPKELPLAVQQRAGLYLWFLLHYRVLKTLGHQPTPADLHEIALGAHPRTWVVVNADETLVEDLLRKVFELPPLRSPTSAGQLAVIGSAIVGALIDDPEADLDEAKPHLEEWWRHHRNSLLAKGLSERD